MQNLLIIGLGGFAGAILRYSVAGFIQDWSRSVSFPYGTITVNLLGCFLIGALSQLVVSRGAISPEYRSLIFLGFLGSFTTFSTFGNETLNLLLDGEHLLSFFNVLIHICFGLASVWLGRVIVSALWS